MEIIALVVIQLVATIAAFGIVWRKLDQVSGELARVRRMLETLELIRFAGAGRGREAARAEAFAGAAATAKADVASKPPEALVKPPLVRPPRTSFETPRRHFARQFMANEAFEETRSLWRENVSPETGRVISAAAMAVAPAVGFAFGAPAAALIAAGLSIAAALMLVSLRPLWRSTAWVAVLAAGGWTLAAYALNNAAAAPISFSLFSALAGACGLAHARLRRIAPGASLALLIGASLLALGGDIGLVSAAGVGFGALAVLAAMIGATSLRVEALHVAAFLAIGVGLFVLSGQSEAAIWFTPATAWAGALFFAIAAVRVPVLGPRGVLLAGTGAASPILAAGALFASQHGLAEPFAAAGVFASLAVMFFGLLAAAARRVARGVAGLKLTAWILTAAAIASAAAALTLATAPAFVATGMAALALGFVLFDQRLRDGLWRGGAITSMLIAAAAAWVACAGLWPPPLVIAFALAAPTILAALAAYVAQRATPAVAAFFETTAIAGAVLTSAALLRYGLGAGAPNTAPFGFAEAGAHIASLLGFSLALAARGNHGARSVRRMAAAALALFALAASVIASLLWLTPHWIDQPATGIAWPLLQHAPLGFALPAILAWAHWAFWRERNAHTRTRVALAAAALMTAAFISLEVWLARADAPIGALDWISISTGVLAFGLAIALNFAPGVTADGARSNFQEYFHRNRSGQQRR